MTEYEVEPIPGLPGHLPPGEHILWQGSPDRAALARGAFHTWLIGGYFAVLATVAVAGGSSVGMTTTIGLGVTGVALLHLLAWASARSTIYTLTNRRIVMRIGVAVPKCINLPLAQIGSVDLAEHTDGTGDLPLALTGQPVLGYVALWPHARPWKLARPQPMLRAVPDAANVAALIARTCLAANPDGRVAAAESRTTGVPAFAEAQAA
jgi:hypothetical protein